MNMRFKIIQSKKSHGLSISTDIMTLNDPELPNIALILRYFTEFDSFAGRLRHSG